MTYSFIGRRWVEFTKGYGGYLNFSFNFSNFIIIFYALLPGMSDRIDFPIFVILIVTLVIPLATSIGHVHFKKQYQHEMGIAILENPYTFKLIPKSKEIPTYNIFLTILEELHHNADPERKPSLDTAIKECKSLLAGNDTREKVE